MYKNIIRILIGLIIPFSMFTLWKTGIMDHDVSSDTYLSEVVSEIDISGMYNFKKNKDFSIAEMLCLSWVGEREEVNCKTGGKLQVENFDRSLGEKLKYYINTVFPSNKSVPKILNTKNAYLSSVDYCQLQIEKLTLLRSKLNESKNRSLSISALIVSLDYKIKYSKDELLLIKTRLLDKDLIDTDDYERLFNLLLYLEGYSYSSESGDFKKTLWDVSRVFDENQSFSKQVKINNFFYKATPLFLIILPILTYFLINSSVSINSNICLFLVLAFMSLGLLFTSNASLNYGSSSIIFELNPLSNQISRQSFVLLVGYTMLLVGYYSIHLFQRLLLTLDRNIKRSCFFGILLVVISYGLISPALGSEFLKFVVVTFASIVTFRHAKETFLANKYLQKKNTIKDLIKLALPVNKNNNVHSASQFISNYILKSFLSLIIVSACTISLSALFFGDLGGALILTLILIVLVFLLFGAKLAFVGISTLSAISLLLLSTNKVNERIDLMITPMYASVSDFARLIGFTHAAGDDGYGISKIPWCNGEGICLPLQVLSDYMPTLIIGALGPKYGLLIFFLYFLLFIVVITKSIYLFLIPEKKHKLIAVFVFYLATAYLIQTLLTFFGNWRIVPLSGLSVPFMSIGLSSILFPCFIFGIFMRLNSGKDINK